jgi:hypothetical protein
VYVVIVGLSSGSTTKPKELKMAESQRKSERATLYGALARDFVKERVINRGAQSKLRRTLFSHDQPYDL